MDVRIIRARKIFGDGRHNAFTGIGAGFGRTYVAFRSGSTHMSVDGGIRVIGSGDLETWGGVLHLSHPDADLRDPKLAFFGGKLRLYFAHRERKAPRRMMTMESGNGLDFGAPVAVRGIPEGHWLWHAREHGGVLYGTAYGRAERGGHEVALYSSGDGTEWSLRAALPVPGNETPLDFDADGTLWALVRDDFADNVPTLCSAKPPYARFDSARRLPMRMQGPMLKRLRGGCVAIGRQWDGPGWRNLRTDAFWIGDGDEPRRICTLPSGGDTSYADWLDVAEGRAAVSYYSSHEHCMDEEHGGEAVFPRMRGEEKASMAADVYLAEVSYAEEKEEMGRD